MKSGHQLNKKCLTAFAAATAAIATPAGASDVFELSDGERTVHVYEFNQDDGLSLVREFNSQTNLEHGSDEYYAARTRYLRNKIRQDMVEKGYDRIFVSRFSQQIAQTFSRIQLTRSESLTFDENNFVPFNGTGPFAYKPPLLSKEHCAIVTASYSYSSQTWISDWVELEQSRALPAQYGRMISEFANYHERAHCLDFDEAGADYIATLQMMRDYQDQPEMVEGMLWLMAGMRFYKNLNSEDFFGTYTRTGAYIHMAMRDYKATPDRFQHDILIYAQRENNMPTDEDYIAARERYLLPSLQYMETIAEKPLCKVAETNITVSYNDPICQL